MKHAHSTTQCTPTNSHVGSELWGQPPAWDPPGSAVEPLQTPGLPVVVGSRPPPPSLSQAAGSKLPIGTRGGGPECIRDSESLQLAVFFGNHCWLPTEKNAPFTHTACQPGETHSVLCSRVAPPDPAGARDPSCRGQISAPTVVRRLGGPVPVAALPPLGPRTVRSLGSGSVGR